MLQKFIVIILALLIVSCTSDPQKKAPKTEATQCPEQRPQICTREYLPVCATRDTGIRCVTAPCPSSEEETYGNACSACGDPKVIRYRPGACKQDTGKKSKQ